ncbi:MAG: hypothetical protein KKB13_26830, partial [Chloroflexi bacterium]|nr:hypothetical protein [Chloroflexota bacterium]
SAIGVEPNCILWRFKNDHPQVVYLAFYSQDRDYEWPGGGQVYILDDDREYTFKTCGNQGEQVCYGAWTADGTYWGVGRNNQYGCQDCCYWCDGVATGLIRFIKG